MGTLDPPTVSEIEVWITVRQGHRPGQQFMLKRFPIVIGRGDDCDVRIEDSPERPTISRRHARLDVSSGRLTVEDLSTNGTWVESHHLRRGEAVPLEHGESVWLGSKTEITIDSSNTIGRQPPAPLLPAVPAKSTSRHATWNPEDFDTVLVQPGPEVAAGHTLNVVTLGQFAVLVDGTAVPDTAWASRKAIVLLVYLAEHQPRTMSMEKLYEALWTDDRGTRQALQTAVSRLRQALRHGQDSLPDPLRFDHHQYGLSEAYQTTYDARTFEMGCKTARRLWEEGDAAGFERTLATCRAAYRGGFLEAASEDWVLRRRTTLEQLYAEATVAMAVYMERQNNQAGALELYQSLVARDPGRENAHEGLIRCLAGLGRRDDALRQYQSSIGELKRVLGVSPTRSLVELRETVLGGLEPSSPPSPYL